MRDDRLTAIAREAAEQSGRLTMPTVFPLSLLADVLAGRRHWTLDC